MRLLLDTHIVLWFMDDNPRLSREARQSMVSATEIYVSAASLWEIGIKARVGKFKGDLEEIVQGMAASGFEELPVFARHGVVASKLPFHHRDPFDRMLVAQAISEPMNLLTVDPQLKSYSELVMLV